MNDEEYLNAASRLTRAIELDSSKGLYYYYRGLARFREEDYLSSNDNSWRSANDFEKAIQRGRDSARTRFMYGNSLLNRGLHYQQNDNLERAIKLFKESIKQYRRVLVSDWNASNAYHNMGVAYLAIGKLNLAKKAVEKAILSEPDVSFFHDTLGEIYYQLGNFKKAIESWNLARELDPDYENHPFEPLLFNRSIEQRLQEAKLRR
jgi:tetratricopeptide (TPR) repeat protein